MKIGILGAGNIGGNLGQRWSAAGHDVCFGVRDVKKAQDLVERCGPRARAAPLAEAAAFGEVTLLAVPGRAIDDVLAAAGHLSGRLLIDATNVIKWEEGPLPAVFPSAAEALAERSGARVVKAFNTLGAEHILNPVVGGQPADLFLCGDDERDRTTVAALAEEIGFRAVEMGSLRYAGVLEHLAVGWIFLQGKRGRDIAFKLVG